MGLLGTLPVPSLRVATSKRGAANFVLIQPRPRSQPLAWIQLAFSLTRLHQKRRRHGSPPPAPVPQIAAKERLAPQMNAPPDPCPDACPTERNPQRPCPCKHLAIRLLPAVFTWKSSPELLGYLLLCWHSTFVQPYKPSSSRGGFLWKLCACSSPGSTEDFTRHP
ncbi:hypothetical protein Anapl_17528 [Anas platyrhynchos]|uniref:Uncharacterized protein n=1 Tax=Anas platyrhynchos TaxID=8839 RepID=R0JEC3_ANAPL|nr:hypothetical protein Anapl_17528 [Anas platyrhynchos]